MVWVILVVMTVMDRIESDKCAMNLMNSMGYIGFEELYCTGAMFSMILIYKSA